jgi:hypothetical protein
MFVELVPVEQDDLQANLASGQEDKKCIYGNRFIFPLLKYYNNLPPTFSCLLVDPDVLHKEYPGYELVQYHLPPLIRLLSYTSSRCFGDPDREFLPPNSDPDPKPTMIAEIRFQSFLMINYSFYERTTFCKAID